MNCEPWMLAAAQEINRVQLSRDHVLKGPHGIKSPIMSVNEQCAIMMKNKLTACRHLNTHHEGSLGLFCDDCGAPQGPAPSMLY